MLKLEGVVEHVIYENPDTGYAVFEVDAGGTDIVVAGNVGSVDNGMSITAYGYMVNHPSYGEQFRAETCEASLPQDTAALLSYLSSGVLPYIGPSTAKKIVAKFGAHTLNVISETPDKLCELKGITPQKAAAISNEFRRMYGVREVVAWMAKFGLSAQMAVTAYRAFGPATVEALKKNPYMLCGEPLNLKFSQVDGIAAQLQVGQGSDLRIAAGLLYALRHNANNGHTCLPADKLIESTARFIRVEPDAVKAGLQSLLEHDEMRACTFDGTKYIYLPDLLSAEQDIAARLGELATFPTEGPKTLESDIRVLELTQGFEYAPLQREAIRLALSSRVMVLTGGPGTGKTTTVKAILNLYEGIYDRVALCAPTGSVELNRRLQAILNPPAPDKPQIIWEQSGRVLRCGDKVMQIKNDYDIPYERDGAEAGVGAYNGDMGIITAVDPESRAVTVQMDDRKYIYGADQLAELEPAYAVTVHKSQGSEFPAVIMPVADVPARLCYRNLLYTGVTRARRLCILAGTRRTEQAMVDNVRQNMRYSGLRYLLREAVTPAEKRR